MDIDLSHFGFPEFSAGSVWLVGAGPGDPGLMSLLALHALQHADDVVYDALVDARVLRLARKGAVLTPAGKRGGRPSPQQPDISRILIERARAGSRVLRLKGGDPFVFGRGGEEALALEAADIPYRIVPGITAGIAGLAYAGIPATQRGANSAVAFVTGYASGGALPADIDWHALAKGAPLIVVYMAMNHLAQIAAKLIEAGRGRDEPVVIISKATTPQQRIVELDLAKAAAGAIPADIEPPALVAIGRTIRLKGVPA
jgi:uroporphyrin-III C-methyltransferase